MMKAAVIHQFGGPEVLKLEQVAHPKAGVNEVLVRVYAAGVNPIDYLTRMGSGVAGEFKEFPAILGWDIAGVVEEVGLGVARFKVGDAVYGMPNFPKPAGAYAEYAVAPAGELVRKPESLSFEEAAALPLTALTAWRALEAMNLQPGQTLLIHAAAGGVGHLAVQLAKARGLRVIGTASKANEALVKDLGADEFVDYSAGPFEAAVGKVDAVLDCVGSEVLERSYAVVKPGGWLVTMVGLPSQERAKELGIHAWRVYVNPSGEELNCMNHLVETGQLRPSIGATFPLADVPEAHRLSETGHVRGKLVLTIH
jgi:NADPH:quinone reductase